MLNSELKVKEVLRFAPNKLARDDGFCTGAGFIKQKYVSFGFSVSICKIQ